MCQYSIDYTLKCEEKLFNKQSEKGKEYFYIAYARTICLFFFFTGS